MEKMLISACLLGLKSRYDGKSKKVISEEDVALLSEKYQLVPFCPEIYGGLPTPRTPSERIGSEVYMKNGTRVTNNYKTGAEEAMNLCRIMGIKKALLKERSPSCGKGYIYDGTFTDTLTERDGVTAELLMKNGIEVFGESEIKNLLK